jgi:hypothetical protein
LFGIINRREDIETKVCDLLKEPLVMNLALSARYLISSTLETSDEQLRSRILHYMTESYAVPLVLMSQNTFLDNNNGIRYVPEILFNMSDGFGVLNFGFGTSDRNAAELPCGKSRFLNDLLIPDERSLHTIFAEDDETPFQNGHVDVFFDKNLKYEPKKDVPQD